MDTIGKRIKSWRKSIGHTQATYSELSGISIGVLKKYEADYNTPGGEALAAIVSTGVNAHWLLTGEGDMTQDTAEDHSVPHDLDALQNRFNHLFELILQIDEDKREAAIDEMLSHVKESARINELERLVKELKKEQ